MELNRQVSRRLHEEHMATLALWNRFEQAMATSARTWPAAAEDPEIATLIREGIRRMHDEDEEVFFYLTVHNENYAHPAIPAGDDVRDGIIRGMYRFRAAAGGSTHGSGTNRRYPFRRKSAPMATPTMPMVMRMVGPMRSASQPDGNWAAAAGRENDDVTMADCVMLRLNSLWM